MNKALQLLTLPFMLLLALAAGTIAQKAESDVQQAIESAKKAGEPYDASLWHAAQKEYLDRQNETRQALENGLLLDGGSDQSNATEIDANPYVDSGNTTGKGNDASIPSCLSGGNDTAEDAWYVVTLTEAVYFTVWTTCESDGPPSYDTRLGIFNNSLALIACNDDAGDCGSPYYQSEIFEEPLDAGTYYVVVDGYNGAEGPYEFNASWYAQPPPCLGSNQSNAVVIASLPYTDQGSTVGACDDITIPCELSGPNDAPDFWYQIEQDTTTLLTVWITCDEQWFDTKIAILDSDLIQIYCNDDDPTCTSGQSRITDAALYPGLYYIIVDGWQSSEGDYELNVDGEPFDPGEVTDLLPDIIIRESDLYDHDIITQGGRTLLRLSNGTANIGEGKLYLYGVLPDNGDGTQDVNQRIFRSDGTFWDRFAGRFIFHEGHNHIHFEDWCSYRLREVLPGNGVGDIIAEGTKTSFCILDLGIYDNTLPNFDPDGQFHSCSSTIQGLSVGWIDVYSKSLEGQNIDITDVPDGTYWLESYSDPNGNVLEGNEDDNATRILVVIGQPAPINPDAYEPNETPDMVDMRPPGGPNSPNLGPCNPEKTITGLNIHQSGNEDYFKFYMNDTGSPDDFVSIDFSHSLGDIDMRLLDEQRNEVGQSNSGTDDEYISLDGRPEGWYYIRIFGYNGAVNPDYSLTVNPPANNPPIVETIDPPAGNIFIIHAQETYNVTWQYSDPESDQCWVSVYMNTTPSFDGNELLLPTSINTPAEQGFYVVNTAYLEHDTYWAYCEITDGGTTTGDWSEGTITLIEEPTTGTIAGTVMDEEQNPLEGVHVQSSIITALDSTDVDGDYMLSELDPGLYELTFTYEGFEDYIASDIEVVAGETTSLDITMSALAPAVFAYLTGDANMFNETIELGNPLTGPWRVGGDVTFLVNYLDISSGNQPCYMNNPNASSDLQYFYAAGDATGDCLVLGGDVSRLVQFFGGNPEAAINWCGYDKPDPGNYYPPLWFNNRGSGLPEEVPALDDLPAGWPDCQFQPEAARFIGSVNETGE